jgi:hypothetical protein
MERNNMSTSIALVPIAEIQAMAFAFAKSGLFGTKTQEQCMALLLLASAEGVHPAIAMRDFDVIQGKPAKKAEAMLRSFLAAGGAVEWHELTDTKADATFSHPQGGKARISWDMERAKKAGLAGKDTWQKFARAMLRSRVVSEGCRTVYPAATSGMYEPGEVRAMGQVEKDMGTVQPFEESEPEVAKVAQEQIEALHTALSESGVELHAFLEKAGIDDIKELAADDAPKAVEWIKKQKKPAKAAA